MSLGRTVTEIGPVTWKYFAALKLLTMTLLELAFGSHPRRLIGVISEHAR